MHVFIFSRLFDFSLRIKHPLWPHYTSKKKSFSSHQYHLPFLLIHVSLWDIQILFLVKHWILLLLYIIVQEYWYCWYFLPMTSLSTFARSKWWVIVTDMFGVWIQVSNQKLAIIFLISILHAKTFHTVFTDKYWK